VKEKKKRKKKRKRTRKKKSGRKHGEEIFNIKRNSFITYNLQGVLRTQTYIDTTTTTSH